MLGELITNKNHALAVGYERISAGAANQILPPRANPPLGSRGMRRQKL